MAEPLQPIVSVKMAIEKVPAGSGTELLEWARRPVAAPGAFKEGRVEKLSRIKRESASPISGDYKVTTWSVEAEDKDGALRALMNAKATRFWPAREGSCQIISQAGMIAGTNPRYLCRGIISDVQLKPSRKFLVEFKDALAFHFTGLNLDKKMPQRKMRRTEHSRLPDENVDRPYPIVWGEHSDEGYKDVNGDPADVGRMPVFDTGDYVLTESGGTPDVESQYLSPPSGGGYTLGGASGAVERQYVVTGVSPYGETIGSATIVVPDGPTTLSPTDSIDLSWSALTDASEYRVYKLTDGAFKLIARRNNNETFVSPETSWSDDGSATTKAPSPPVTNTAQIDQEVDGEGAFGWGRLVVSIGEMHSWHDVYASNLAEGEAQKRVKMEEDVYGSEFLIPDRPGWPHADRTVTINGIEMSVMYARGPRLKAHRDGTITITVNGCGAFGPNGKVYDEAFPTLQWVINEHVLKNNGQGYYGGAYGPLVTYADGVPIVKPSAYAAAQARTVEYIGGRGYLTAGWIGEEITVREFVHRYMQTFDFVFADDHQGQIYPFFIENVDVDFGVGRVYRERIELRRVTDIQLLWDSVETGRKWDYDFNPAANEFSVKDQKYEDETWSEYYKEPKFKDKKACYYTRHKVTVWDAQVRHVNRFKDVPRLLTFETDYTGLEDENGDQIRVQSNELDDAGTLHPMVVLTHEVDPNSNEEKAFLTCFDLSRYFVLEVGAPDFEVVVSIPTAVLDVEIGFSVTAPSVAASAPTAVLNVAAGSQSLSASAASVTVSAASASVLGGSASLIGTASSVTVTAAAGDIPQVTEPPSTNRTGWWRAAEATDLFETAALTGTITDTELVKGWQDRTDAVDLKFTTGSPDKPPTFDDNGMNGKGCLQFNGTDTFLRLFRDDGVDTANKLTNLITGAAYTYAMAINVTGNGTNNASVYANPGIWEDSGQWIGLYVKTNAGVTTLNVFHWDGSAKTIAFTINQNQDYVLRVRYDGVADILYASLDGGSESSVSSVGSIGSLSGNVDIGRATQPATDLYGNFKLGEMVWYNAFLAGADLTQLTTYMVNEWI